MQSGWDEVAARCFPTHFSNSSGRAGGEKGVKRRLPTTQ